MLSTLGHRNHLWYSQYRLKGIDFAFRGHAFDFAIPSYKLLIEADGCMFHGCPVCLANGTGRERDRLIVARAADIGWTVLRYWGHQIKRQPNEVLADIRKHMGQ